MLLLLLVVVMAVVVGVVNAKGRFPRSISF